MARELITFGESIRPVMDCIEQLSTGQPVRSRMKLTFFVNKYLTAMITDQEVPGGAKLPRLPDEVLKAESWQSSFEHHDEELPDSVRLRVDTLTQCHKYASRYDPIALRLFEASGCIKSELRRRCLFDCLESD